jgi:DNA modification methylase
VLDPFGGTGTTARAALRLNRRAVCTELSAASLLLAQQRIAAQQVSLFEASSPRAAQADRPQGAA